MKHKTKVISVLLCLTLVLFVFPLGVLAQEGAEAGDSPIPLEPGYDYTRFKDAGLTLNVYNWGEYISDGTDGEHIDVNAVFEEVTGIKVNYATYETNESLYAKLKSGGAEYDVVIPSDYMIGRLIEEGLLAKLNYENIPNFSMIGQQYKGRDYDPKDEYSVAYTWGYVGIIYNTTMVDKPVDSWGILWDEDYKNDILMFDNSRDAFAIASRLLGLPINPENTEQIDQAAAALEEQRPLVQAYVMDQIFDKMQGGEAALAPYYAGDAVIMNAANPDLSFAVPKEGTNYFVDAMCVPAGSPNQEAAEMYINFMCETAVAMDNSLFIGYSTPQLEAEAAMPPEVRDNPWLYPPAEVLENTWTFNVLPKELNDHMDTAWNDMRTQTGAGGWIIVLGLVLAVAVIVVSFVLRARKKRQNEY
ncbi:spermidine/putrescine ABC transporter substrate-binding protein [Ruminococcaceae bacterium OttesenSCG-928-I18]|nr:spermidine/putrescine ABC transporter substrate-binding protein [Ruminococcaceae bacterium OttesenSCG-928-I18]